MKMSRRFSSLNIWHNDSSDFIGDLPAECFIEFTQMKFVNGINAIWDSGIIYGEQFT